MYLKNLQIIGFKSFADKVSIEFDSGMTAIVGPNGCGKTNIVDAVRWVIGEQKASVLRSTTMENVIFNGTKNRKPSGYAEVSLTIENTKGILPSEYTEITLSRRCFRDGQSNYILNGTQCRLKDITSLFMDTGMGADAYSVIELKMVNDIISPRTQDRRKLFEEAAGITKYKERRREAFYKLELAKESINEANTEIRTRQRAVNSYEKLVQRRQEANELADKLKNIEVDYHKRYYSKLVNDSKLIEDELLTKDKERDELQAKYLENEKILEKYKSELLITEKSLNSVREKFNASNTAVKEIQNKIAITEQHINFLKENIERFEKEKIETEKQILKLEQKSSELEEKISILNHTITLLDDSLTNKKLSLEDTDTNVKSSKEELKDLASKHSSIIKHLTEKQNEYELLKSKLETQLSRCSSLMGENIANITKLTEIEAERENLEISKNKSRQELTKLSREFENLRIAKKDLTEEIYQAEKIVINLSHEIEKLKDKISFQVNLLETFEDYSEGVKYLVKEAPQKEISTIIDNIEVEEKFRVAIETALGEISNYLIIKNISSAKEFIKILKEKEKGKVTFILQENLVNTTFNIFQDEFPELLSQEGVYGWADKFVKCPAEYFLLYKYLLDEYIIVENLDTAFKLSKDSFIKFITLDGDIVTSSFLRAGSSTKIETLKIGREKLINDFQKRVSELEIILEKEKSVLETLNENNSSLDTESISLKVENLKNEISGLENKISQAEYLKQQINTLNDKNNRENETLSSSNKELTEKIDKLIIEIENSENIRYQREKELEHFTTELENLTDELTSKREEYNNFLVEATKIKSELANAENELFRIKEQITINQELIVQKISQAEENKSEIIKLNSELEQFDGEDNLSSGLKYELLNLENENKLILNDLTYINSEYDAKRSLVDSLESEQKNLRDEREKIVEYIHNMEIKITKDRLEMKEHKDRIKEEYDIDIQYQIYDDEAVFDYVKTKSEIEKLKIRLRELGGSGQLELGLYEQEKQELERLIEQRNDLLKAEEDLMKLIDEINKTAQEKFTQTFELICSNFQKNFRELFMEGDEADLKLVYEPENPDPLDAKIDIIAKPRGKRPQLIDLLSGGEKTLTAIALLFAIYQVKPSPFCILDEVDAPLDDANIDRFIKIIRKFSEDTQFIIVTHNKRTMEAANEMYGVTMAEEGISTIVNVKFTEKISTN